MWIFLPGGLLMPAEFPADKVDIEYTSADPEKVYDLQIRARVESHLTNFIRDYMDPNSLPYSKIQATPEMDYNFRFYCNRADFAIAMAHAILDIDYLKFKPTAEAVDTEGKKMYADGAQYHSVLNSIWSTVCRLGTPGGVWGTYSSTNPRGYKPGTKGPYSDAVSVYSGRTYGESRGYYGSRYWDDEPGPTLGDYVGLDRDPGDDDWSITDDVRDADFYASRSDLDVLEEHLDFQTASDLRREMILDQVSDLPVADWPDWLDAEEMEVVRNEYNRRLGVERKRERNRRRSKRSGKHREERRASFFRA